MISSRAAAEKLEIAELINRYFAALDEKHLDVTTMSELFAAYAQFLRPNGTVTSGPQSIADSHIRSLSRFRATQHLASGFIVVLGENQQSADVRANFVAMHLWADGHGDQRVDPNDNYFVAGGVITGHVALEADGWKITEFANKPTWRRGVGFQQMLETK